MHAHFVRGLKCRLCGKEYPLKALNFCTEDFGPVEVFYDYDALKSEVSRPLFERPHPEASEVPVASEHRHLPPGIVPAENPPVSHVPHDVRVGAHGSVWLDVGIAKGAEQ